MLLATPDTTEIEFGELATPDTTEIHEDDPYEFGACVDCGSELYPYEDKICLDCEAKRAEELGEDVLW